MISESLERDLSNDVLQSKFCRGPNLSFFGLGPWAIIIHGIAKLVTLKYDFWWYHLNYFFLSFQKIPQNVTLDPQNSSYGSRKNPQTIGCSWTSFNSLNLSIVYPMSKILWFSESLESDLSNDVLQSKFCQSPNLSFFGLGPWAIIHGIAKLANTFISQIWFLMTPFELFFLSFQKMWHWIHGIQVMAAERIPKQTIKLNYWSTWAHRIIATINWHIGQSQLKLWAR